MIILSQHVSVSNDLPRQTLHWNTSERWQSLVPVIHLDFSSGQCLLKQEECLSSGPNYIAYMQTVLDKQPKFS